MLKKRLIKMCVAILLIEMGDLCGGEKTKFS